MARQAHTKSLSSRSTVATRRRADLLSGTGAFVAGLGVAGVFLRDILSARAALVLLAAGAVAHAAGMVIRFRLDTAAAMPTWARIAYWSCWALIIVAAVWSVPLVTR